jgi:hypothetical protein
MGRRALAFETHVFSGHFLIIAKKGQSDLPLKRYFNSDLLIATA